MSCWQKVNTWRRTEKRAVVSFGAYFTRFDGNDAMSTNTDDLRIRNLRELVTPEALIAEMPADESVAQHVTQSRTSIQSVLNGTDDRLVVVIGPCSIHDPAAALDYAARLKLVTEQFSDLSLIHI